MSKPPNFEIPKELTEMAEQNVKLARDSYAQFMDSMVQASRVWLDAMPGNSVSGSVQAIQEKSVTFAKQNAEANFNLAEELSRAKDVQEVLAIQSRHAQQQMQAYSLQAQELSRMMMAPPQAK